MHIYIYIDRVRGHVPLYCCAAVWYIWGALWGAHRHPAYTSAYTQYTIRVYVLLLYALNMHHVYVYTQGGTGKKKGICTRSNKIRRAEIVQPANKIYWLAGIRHGTPTFGSQSITRSSLNASIFYCRRKEFPSSMCTDSYEHPYHLPEVRKILK